MKRFRKWLEHDPVNILATAVFLTALITGIGLTATIHRDAQREFAFQEHDGSYVARWNAGTFSFAVYTRYGDMKEDVARVGLVGTAWVERTGKLFRFQSCWNNGLWRRCNAPGDAEQQELLRLLREGRRRTSQII